MKFVSWNQARRAETWEVLLGLEPAVALLQEAVPPPTALFAQARTWPPADADWRADIRGVRPNGAAICCLDDQLAFTPLETVLVGDVVGEQLAQSHPNQFAAARIGAGDDELVAVSLYGLWERQGSTIYSEATLHRAISDLTPLMQSGVPMLIAGDLNIFLGYSTTGHRYWIPRFDTIFERLAAYGLELVGPKPDAGRGPLERCRCASPDCQHVQTYRHQYKKDASPDQLDFVFASKRLKPRIRFCVTIDNDSVWAASDHCPIVVDIAFGSEEPDGS